MRSRLLAAALFMGLGMSPAYGDGHSENRDERMEEAIIGSSAEGQESAGPGFHMENLYRACLRGRCLQASREVVQGLQMDYSSQEQLNAQFGYVALAVFQSARNSDRRRTQAQVAAVLSGLSRLSTQDTQSNIFREVAQALIRGKTDVFDQENPFHASPTGDHASDRRRANQARRDALLEAIRQRQAERENPGRSGNS